jgi:hypothetical protein
MPKDNEQKNLKNLGIQKGLIFRKTQTKLRSASTLKIKWNLWTSKVWKMKKEYVSMCSRIYILQFQLRLDKKFFQPRSKFLGLKIRDINPLLEKKTFFWASSSYKAKFFSFLGTKVGTVRGANNSKS